MIAIYYSPQEFLLHLWVSIKFYSCNSKIMSEITPINLPSTWHVARSFLFASRFAAVFLCIARCARPVILFIAGRVTARYFKLLCCAP